MCRHFIVSADRTRGPFAFPAVSYVVKGCGWEVEDANEAGTAAAVLHPAASRLWAPAADWQVSKVHARSWMKNTFYITAACQSIDLSVRMS